MNIYDIYIKLKTKAKKKKSPIKKIIEDSNIEKIDMDKIQKFIDKIQEQDEENIPRDEEEKQKLNNKVKKYNTNNTSKVIQINSSYDDIKGK